MLEKLHNKGIHNLYSSPNIIRMMKSRRLSWVGHASRIGEERNAYKMLMRKPKGDQYEDLGAARGITLKWTLKE
jgi:hypothetical protein